MDAPGWFQRWVLLNCDMSVSHVSEVEMREPGRELYGAADRDLVSEEKGASQRVRLTGANKRMFNLLKKAKVQLIKIDQQKQLKSSGVIYSRMSI